MSKKIKPFSNGNEAMNWQSQNCDICTRMKCYAKLSIERGFITGEIIIRQAEFTGYSGSKLNHKCNKFNIANEKKIFKK